MLLTWKHVTQEQFEALVAAADDLCVAVETGGGTFPFEMAYRLRQAVSAPEPRPDYDPRTDHPERYTEGPV